MTTSGQVIWIIILVLMFGAPVSIIYSWYYFLKRMLPTKRSWRDYMSVAATFLITIVAIAWIPCITYLRSEYIGPGGLNWKVYEALGQFLRPAILTIVLSILLGVVGRPRLIMPLMVGSLGTFCWWVLPILTR
jgi:hypothetical protein